MSTLQAINFKNASYGGTYNIQMDAYGSAFVANNLTTAGYVYAKGGIQADVGFVPPFAFYLKNRLINGTFLVAQRAATGTNNITTTTTGPTQNTGYTTVDRWFTCATTTSTAPSSAQTVGVNSVKQLTITGAIGTTAVYVGQRIIAANSYDLVGKTVTLSFSTSNSLLTSISYQVSYATTYADQFGTLAVPTKTIISAASGSQTITGTLTQYYITFTVPSAAVTGLEVLFSVGAQTSGTWVLQDVQLELGPNATAIERRPFPQELALCQAYYEKSFPLSQAVAQNAGRQGMFTFPSTVTGAVATNYVNQKSFVVPKRTFPTSFQATASTTTLTVTSMNYGVITLGMSLSGTGAGGTLGAGCTITAFGTGTGGAGTYTISTSQTITPAITVTGQAGPVVTLYSPAAASAQAYDFTAGAVCTTSLANYASDESFLVTTTGASGTVIGGWIGVHWAAEIEVP